MHTAKITRVSEEEKKMRTITLPSVSADFNLKHLWAILKRKVEKQKPSAKSR